MLGRELVLKGLQEGVLYRKEDGSVWANLEEEDHLILRAVAEPLQRQADASAPFRQVEAARHARRAPLRADRQPAGHGV